MTTSDILAQSDPAVRRLTGTIGAEISGVKLADANAATVEKLREAVLAHRVIVIRDQFLEPERQISFGLRLGPFMTIRGIESNLPWPELFRITNTGKSSAAAEMWHTDGITLERPPSFSILSADTLPEAGGDTLFVDMGYAYRTLSPAYRRLLRGLRARHRARRFGDEEPREVWHPLVRTIPETGERVLYLGASTNVADIEGMTAAESRPLLDFLFDHATRPDGMYRHSWRPGDVVIWDNRAAMHYAVHDYGDAPRTLIRMMIEGDAPFEAPYPEKEI